MSSDEDEIGTASSIQLAEADENIIQDYLAEATYDFNRRWISPKVEAANLRDFQLIRTLGVGAFGRVILVKHNQTSSYQAMKVLNKLKLVKLQQVNHAKNEKKILAAIRYPFITQLIYRFKDNSNLYLVMEYVPGGELFSYLRSHGRFSEDICRFFASQIVLCIEYLQTLDLFYRDFKPENLLIDADGYIKITDFGFAKRATGWTYTICGTPEYLAPEIILNKGYTKAVDWWAFGVLIYEMVSGYPPFYGKDPVQIYSRILSGSMQYPEHISHELTHLLKNLIQHDTSKRYGTLKNGISDIKTHDWFKNVDWIATFQKKIEPPFIPKLGRLEEGRNFEKFVETPLFIAGTSKCEQEFADF